MLKFKEKNYTDRFYKWLLVLFILALFFRLYFLGQQSIRIYDWDIYVRLAHMMNEQGAIFYHDMSDIKNVGFMYIVAFLMKIYSLFFDSYLYLTIYFDLILTLMYIATALLIYSVIRKVLDSKFYSFLLTVEAFLFLSYIDHIYFFNVPQLGMFIIYLTMFYILSKEYLNYKSWFIVGLLLGLVTSISINLLMYTLVVPFIIYLEDQTFVSVIKKGFVTFCGFLLVLCIPIAYYAYLGDLYDLYNWSILKGLQYGAGNSSSLTGAWEWINPVFQSGIYAVSYIRGFVYTLDGRFTTYIGAFYFAFISFIVFFLRPNKKETFTRAEWITFFFAFSCLLSAYIVSRPHVSYFTYLVPLYFIAFPIYVKPLNWLTSQDPHIKKVISISWVILLAILWLGSIFHLQYVRDYTELESYLYCVEKKNPNFYPTIVWHSFGLIPATKNTKIAIPHMHDFTAAVPFEDFKTELKGGTEPADILVLQENFLDKLLTVQGGDRYLKLMKDLDFVKIGEAQLINAKSENIYVRQDVLDTYDFTYTEECDKEYYKAISLYNLLFK